MTEQNPSRGGARRGLPANDEAIVTAAAASKRSAEEDLPSPDGTAQPSRAKRGEQSTQPEQTELAAAAETTASQKGKKRTIDPQKRRRYRIQSTIIILVTLLGIGSILGYQWFIFQTSGTLSNAPVWEPGMIVTAPEVPEPEASTLAHYQCPTTENAPFVPTTFAIPSKDISMKVLSLGLDANGAAAAPPDTEPRLLSWFNLGPKPGSAEGQVLITGHTFKNSMAIGNELNAGLLTPGDVVVVSDDNGNSACYQYTHDLKIRLVDYDPQSNLIYDNYGDPRLAIIVCADWAWTSQNSDSRILYYFNLLPPTEAS